MAMAYSPSHRSPHSITSSNLQPLSPEPSQKQQRRMTSPAMSSSSLNLPQSHRSRIARPPSPLRNGFVPDTSTGIDTTAESEDGNDDEDDDHRSWVERSPSPASSVSQFAASFAQRVGSFVGQIAPRSPGYMLTDAELEAEAERERDRSRKEAERILTREAQERKLVEERVLAMMENTKALPPPPSRSQTMPNPPSPSSSQKESTSWWAAAKNKLTPTKEPLTPAQQVIQEAKAREKERKAKEKEKEKEKEWPANSQGKYVDPAFLNLNIPVAPPQRKPVPTSPSSPTPSRPSLSNLPPNLTPSPMRQADLASSSPSREAPPLYAQFNPQGTLDVPGSLLTIAKRFEKLEKWTVGHVRALEERMSDVERWLVDKEKEKEDGNSLSKTSQELNSSTVTEQLQDIQGELSELQGRVGELGREMAKLATAPSNLSSGPSRQTAPVSIAPKTTSSIVVHSNPPEQTPVPIPMANMTTPHHSRLVLVTGHESTSPPMVSSKSTSGTRLPYPSGDYVSPSDTSVVPQGTFSPAHSPPSSLTTRNRPTSISGLPNVGLGISHPSAPISYSSASMSSASSISSGHPFTTSPQTSARAANPISRGLPPPKSAAVRPSSVSPTPRKRYTVALGGPIIAPPELSSDYRRGNPVSFSNPQSIGTAFFSSSPSEIKSSEDKINGLTTGTDEDDNDFQDETIGKSASARLTNTSNNINASTGDYRSSPSPSPSSNRRIRTQSAYGFLQPQPPPPQTPTAPLKPRLRSRSSDRLTSDENTPGLSKFIDPLVLRKQDREGVKIAMPKPVGKVPIGQLVAFFDGEKKDKT